MNTSNPRNDTATLPPTVPPSSSVAADSNTVVRPDTDLAEDMRPEYDSALLKNPVRGKYAARLAEGIRIRIDGVRTVSLPADLDAAFPTDQALFAALHEWLDARQNTPAL